MKTIKKALLLVGLLIGIVYAAMVILVANPFNWFVTKSARFSRDKFDTVQPGMKKEALAKLLGEPLHISEPFSNPECDRCVSYYFMGNAPTWLPGFQEAWVYVGPDGTVRDKVWHTEP